MPAPQTEPGGQIPQAVEPFHDPTPVFIISSDRAWPSRLLGGTGWAQVPAPRCGVVELQFSHRLAVSECPQQRISLKPAPPSMIMTRGRTSQETILFGGRARWPEAKAPLSVQAKTRSGLRILIRQLVIAETPSESCAAVHDFDDQPAESGCRLRSSRKSPFFSATTPSWTTCIKNAHTALDTAPGNLPRTCSMVRSNADVSGIPRSTWHRRSVRCDRGSKTAV